MATSTLTDAEVIKERSKIIEQAWRMLTNAIPDDVPGACMCRVKWMGVPRKGAQLTDITADDIARCIGTHCAPDCRFVVSDSKISTYPRDVFLKFMEFATLRSRKYMGEQYDCDDFALEFAALAREWHVHIKQRASASASASAIGGVPIGICHGRLSATDETEHAFNFWISPDGAPIYIEPQTGEYITLGAGATLSFVYI